MFDTYSLYRLVHLLGIFLLFSALGGATVLAMYGAPTGSRVRKLTYILHGVALLLVLFGGFGLVAKLAVGWPLWVWLKIVIWLLFGAAVVVIRRAGQRAALLLLLLPILGGIAAYLAIYKPF